jgi:hypothetical protein
MITYVLMTGLGVVLTLSAQYAHRTVTLCEPRLVEINPTIREIFLAAKTLGLMIVAAGLASTAVIASS